jgi:argininosuccinate synthase
VLYRSDWPFLRERESKIIRGALALERHYVLNYSRFLIVRLLHEEAVVLNEREGMRAVGSLCTGRGSQQERQKHYAGAHGE